MFLSVVVRCDVGCCALSVVCDLSLCAVVFGRCCLMFRVAVCCLPVVVTRCVTMRCILMLFGPFVDWCCMLLFGVVCK